MKHIGVLIDDLITKEQREPYRMCVYTRAEYRTFVKDNADFRLTPMSHEIGLTSEA
jgi:tRNA uridine 5-carboxymethylaminomethyl modification enzyme